MTATVHAMTETLLAATGLSDLLPQARSGDPLDRLSLERVASSRNPLAAAALADARRDALYGDVVTAPVTLRVTAPWATPDDASPLLVTHAIDELDGIDATECEIGGACPETVDLDAACAFVRSVKAARPDLPLRGFDAGTARRLGEGDLAAACEALRAAGLDVLGHAVGMAAGLTAAEWHAAKSGATGLGPHFPLPYSRASLEETSDDGFVALLASLSRAEEFRDATVLFVPLPDSTAEASPLRSTAGTEDVLAFALARLGFGSAQHHIAVDADVLGTKLGAVLLSAGANDFIGAQAAREWKIPTDDGPRALSAARMQLYVREAQREPVLRDGLLARTQG